MISREFLEWLVSKPVRLMFMVFMAMTMAFCLVMSIGLHMRENELREATIKQIQEIETEANRARDEAARAKAEALKAKVQTDKNARDVKAIEKTIGEDH